MIYGEKVIENGEIVMEGNYPKQRSMKIGRLITTDDGKQFMYINQLPAGKMAAEWDGKVNFYESKYDDNNQAPNRGGMP